MSSGTDRAHTCTLVGMRDPRLNAERGTVDRLAMRCNAAERALAEEAAARQNLKVSDLFRELLLAHCDAHGIDLDTALKNHPPKK